MGSWPADTRLIGFEDLGQTDQFSAKVLEFRLEQTGESAALSCSQTVQLTVGALPSGPVSLANMIGKLDKDDSDSDDDGFRDKSRRRGKVGIRNGLALGVDDE